MEQLLEFIVNHWVLWTAFFLVLGLLLVTEKGGFSQLSALSPPQIIPLINHKSAVVIDIRDAETFATGHIIGSVNFPLAEAEAKIKTIQKYKQKPVILVDANQRDNAKMATILRKNGFTEIFSLRGGIPAWREAQLPLVTEKKGIVIEHKEKEASR